MNDTSHKVVKAGIIILALGGGFNIGLTVGQNNGDVSPAFIALSIIGCAGFILGAVLDKEV